MTSLRRSEKIGDNISQETSPPPLKLFFSCFFRRTTVLKSIKVSLVVGPALVIVNHFEILLGAALSLKLAIKMFLCFLVPFCVSGYSSATTMMKGQAYPVCSDLDKEAGI